MSTSERGAFSDDQIDEAVGQGHNLVSQILSRKPFVEIKPLVEAGAPLWFQDDDGTSALHAAAYVENEELVRYLIENGAIWNAGTSWSRSSIDPTIKHTQSTTCTTALEISPCR